MDEYIEKQLEEFKRRSILLKTAIQQKSIAFEMAYLPTTTIRDFVVATCNNRIFNDYHDPEMTMENGTVYIDPEEFFKESFMRSITPQDHLYVLCIVRGVDIIPEITNFLQRTRPLDKSAFLTR